MITRLKITRSLMWHEQIICITSSSLGQSHASAYRRSLSLSSTTISYSVYVVILGGCLRFKPHWMFQIYKYVIEGREELTSWSSLIHSHMLPLLDVLYRKAGNLSFGQWREHNDISVRFRACVYHNKGSKQAMLSATCQRLVKGSLIGRSCDARHSRYLAI